MKELNPYILLVMKWLDDKDSVTQEELNKNRGDAYAVYAAAADADADAAYAVYAAADADAAYAVYAAAADADAEKWIGKYLHLSGENKKYYIDALNGDDVKPVFTQEMADAGELPSVGMECRVLISNKDSGEEGVIEFKNEQGSLFRYKNNNLCDYYTIDDGSSFEPLTPPIQLEDGECYQFNSPSGGLFKGCYIPVKGLFVAHRGNFDAHLCTNIKLLTVEGE